MTAARIWAVDAASIAGLRHRLGELLIDSVENGASVGFLAPLTAADADGYWRRVELAVGEGRSLLLAAALADGAVAGTVQLDLDTLPNAPHRGTVCKLLVHSSARRQGIGEALMRAVEDAALAAGRWLLTLDTATPEAARLYVRLGWSSAGVVPAYAMNPDGSLTATEFYWKDVTNGRAR